MRDYHAKNTRRARRDYSKRRYGNPLFRQDTRKRNGVSLSVDKIKKIVLIVLFVIALGVLFWYLFWSSTFRISSIEINGASAETEMSIREIIDARLLERRMLVLPQASVFMFDTEAAKATISDSFFFSKLEVDKRLPDGLVIEVEEKGMMAVLLVDNRFMAVEESGFVIRELTERESMMMNDLPEGVGAVVTGELGTEAVDIDEISEGEPDPERIKKNGNPNPLLLIKNGSEDDFNPGETALAAESLSLVMQIQGSFSEAAGAGVRWFLVDPSDDTIEVALKSGWSAYFTTLLPYEVQKNRLALVLKEKVGDRRAELIYIDLRFDERIFIKYTEEEAEEE
jgi:hypothetical protein